MWSDRRIADPSKLMRAIVFLLSVCLVAMATLPLAPHVAPSSDAWPTAASLTEQPSRMQIVAGSSLTKRLPSLCVVPATADVTGVGSAGACLVRQGTSPRPPRPLAVVLRL
jgi:hypothetical protein